VGARLPEQEGGERDEDERQHPTRQPAQRLGDQGRGML
jgi:hypothetical protein